MRRRHASSSCVVAIRARHKQICAPVGIRRHPRKSVRVRKNVCRDAHVGIRRGPWRGARLQRIFWVVEKRDVETGLTQTFLQRSNEASFNAVLTEAVYILYNTNLSLLLYKIK